jgi:tripartite-type tricarboxylate transporter receptor subunit TctC
MQVRTILWATLALTSSAALAATATYPTKPVRLIVSNQAGAAPDVIARLLGSKLTEAWGQQIVVDNRPGATGLIAAEATARAAPDGYTLWLPTMTQLISTLMAEKLQLAREFTPVTYVASTAFVVVVNAALPIKSTAELVAYAKARPAQVLYGSSGQWGSTHLCMELFNQMAGTNMRHVPYKGSTTVLTDLMGGQIHVNCAAAPSLPPVLQSGKVRALGVTTAKPTQFAPGVPTIAETLPGFELVGWYGMVAPKGTPKEIVSRINAEVVKALRSSDVQQHLLAVGAEAVGSTPAELAGFLQKETDRWGRLLRNAGARNAQ